MRLALGANNLFDTYPTRIPAQNGYYGSEPFDSDASQIGIDGGFYYPRLAHEFSPGPGRRRKTLLSRRHVIEACGLLGLAALSQTANAAGIAPPARLSLNENPYGPAPGVRRAITAALAQANRYGDETAADRLVARIAALEGIDKSQIVLGGMLEVLGLFLAARAPSGGRFVYSVPGYTALVDAARPLGGEPVGVPLDAGLGNDLDALDRAVGAGTKALYLINPHNPSGTVSDRVAFDAFLARVAQRTLVVVDEAYLEYDDMARSAARLTRDGHDVAVFRTLDKIHGLAGLPIGYLLAPRPLAVALRSAGFGDPHGLGRLQIAAAGAALADQGWVRQVRSRIAAGRERLTAALDQLGLEHSRSVADFVFFRSPLPAEELRRNLLDRGIVVARPFPPLDGWIRISIGNEAEVTHTIAALRGSLRPRDAGQAP